MAIARWSLDVPDAMCCCTWWRQCCQYGWCSSICAASEAKLHAKHASSWVFKQVLGKLKQHRALKLLCQTSFSLKRIQKVGWYPNDGFDLLKILPHFQWDRMMPSEFAHWPDRFLRGSNLEALEKNIISWCMSACNQWRAGKKLESYHSGRWIILFNIYSFFLPWEFKNSLAFWLALVVFFKHIRGISESSLLYHVLLYWATNFNNQRSAPNHWSGIHGCTKLEILPIHDPVSDLVDAFQPATARTSGEQCCKILFPSRCIGYLSQIWQAKLSICESICWLVQSSLIPGS